MSTGPSGTSVRNDNAKSLEFIGFAAWQTLRRLLEMRNAERGTRIADRGIYTNEVGRGEFSRPPGWEEAKRRGLEKPPAPPITPGFRGAHWCPRLAPQPKQRRPRATPPRPAR